MSASAYIGGWLFAGAVLAALFIRYVSTRARRARRVYAAGLVVAAALYLPFAAQAPNVLAWVVVEAAGIGLFGALAIAGTRSSAGWLAAGWALHPLWDVALHHLGPGGAFTPDWYAIGCVSFDLLVAGHIACRCRSGADVPARSGNQPSHRTAPPQ